MENIDFGTLLFIIATIVIFYQLRSVLGRRTGNERRRFDSYTTNPKPEIKGKAVDTIYSLATGQALTEKNSIDAVRKKIDSLSENKPELNKQLHTIRDAYPEFEPDNFMKGAKAAYEMIVIAYANGDRKTLKNLLSQDVFESFMQAFEEREKKNQKINFSFVGIEKADFMAAGIKKDEVWVQIHFVSKSISATLDQEGNVVEGNLEKLIDMQDVWTFGRKINSSDPNWRLTKTESEA